MTTDTTQISEDVGYALIETHLGLKKRHDHTVIDSKTGRYTDSARYFGLMDAAYQAGHAAGAAETATPVAARWYFVTNDGAATLCVDEADAREGAAEADIAYPRMAPHRAVRLVPASQVAAAVAKERERCASIADQRTRIGVLRSLAATYTANAAKEIAAAIRAGDAKEPSDA